MKIMYNVKQIAGNKPATLLQEDYIEAHNNRTRIRQARR
jgi:hypothetical protein